MYYTIEERREILEIYISCDKDQLQAQREFIRRYPEKAVPSKNTFKIIYDKFVTTNSLKNRKRRKQNPVVTRDMELNVLLYFIDDASHSTRSAATYFGISQRSIGRILKANNYKPYHTLPVQKLSQNDMQNRVLFCQQMLQRINEDETFLKNIFWTDESSFSTAGVFNRRNTHMWCTENPHSVREIKKQGHATVNVWCGIHNNRLYGPVFMEEVLTGPRFLHLLQNNVEAYFEDMPLNEMLRVIWQQDGAPPHNDRRVTNYLRDRFPTWIGRNGPIRWPPRSPDLTPMDFYLWGTMKQQIYGEGLFENVHELKAKIREQVDIINAHADVFPRIRQNFITRLNLCLQSNGGYVENKM